MKDEMYGLHPIDIHDLLAANLPKPPELVHGMIHQGSKVIIGGGSKSYKTWTLLDLAASVAAGVPWWGFQTTKGRVLYVNFEIQDAFFRDRVESIVVAKDAQIDRGQLMYLGMRGKPWETKYLLKATVQMGLAMIVIDPIYKGLGERDENSAGDMAKLMNELEEIAVDTGAAVVFGHHFSKGNQSAKESIDRVSGSGVFARDPDTIIVMTKHQEEEAFTIDPILRNFTPVPAFVVRREHPLMVRADELNPTDLKRPNQAEEKYSDDELMAPLADGGMTKMDWWRAVDAVSDMSRATFMSRAVRLVRSGKVRQEGKEFLRVVNCASVATTRSAEDGGKKTSFVREPKAK